jgi:hypothetical protein
MGIGDGELRQRCLRQFDARTNNDLVSSRLGAAGPVAENRRWSGRLAIGHFLGHVKQQAAVTFFDLAEKPAETAQVTGILAGAAPGDVVRALPLGKIREHGRFFAVVEELIEGHFHCPGQLLESLDCWDGVAVFDARNIAPEQAGALFDVTL